jgi:hypothetical protein
MKLKSLVNTVGQDYGVGSGEVDEGEKKVLLETEEFTLNLRPTLGQSRDNDPNKVFPFFLSKTLRLNTNLIAKYLLTHLGNSLNDL